MRVVVTGATGFLGRDLVRALEARGDEVVRISRAGAGATRAWSELPSVVDGADAVVNLAGEPVVGRRWSAAQKERLRSSRLDATRACVEAISRASRRPRVLVGGSAIGLYGARGDEKLDESAPAGDDFLARLCVDWEAEASRASAATRVVLLRTGIVLGPDGGALEQMVRPFRFGVGGPLGDGAQWMSWISLADWTALALFAIDRDELEGPLNATAPEPVRNRDLASAIGRVLHRPSLLPAPAFALRLALGEVATTLVTGQRVVPARALALGFAFADVDLEPALRRMLASA